MVYANGIGPVNYKVNRFLTRNVVNQVDLITLREETSCIELESLNITRPNILVTADPAFSLEFSRIRQYG